MIVLTNAQIFTGLESVGFVGNNIRKSEDPNNQSIQQGILTGVCAFLAGAGLIQLEEGKLLASTMMIQKLQQFSIQMQSPESGFDLLNTDHRELIIGGLFQMLTQLSPSVQFAVVVGKSEEKAHPIFITKHSNSKIDPDETKIRQLLMEVLSVDEFPDPINL